MRHRLPEERFDEKWEINLLTWCWEWTAAKHPLGYGHFRMDGKILYAHRVSFERFVGEIQRDMTLDHLCRVRHCVNPDHLEMVSLRTNILRGATVTGINALKTHCPSGHALRGDNLYVNPQGSRVCRLCRDAKVKAWYSKRRFA